MEFRYRYVNYGTAFEPAPGKREKAPAGPRDAAFLRNMSQLHENELAFDVGGVCWGVNGTELAVLDHHFHRERGQFPSAAAAVLHNAARIHERFKSVSGPIWLVTHVEPDFDAFSSMYLARGVLQGLDPAAKWSIPHDAWPDFGVLPGGWQEQSSAREIDWFRPYVTGMPLERRWAVLVAAIASCVDQCKPVSCPKNRTLDALLYGAIQRGREMQATGATELFDAVRERLMRQPLLNPLFDSVLEESVEFAPELSLLDRELSAYQQDMRRARRTVVYVQKAPQPFHEWYTPVTKQPLLGADGHVRDEHLYPDGHEYAQVDAVFLRDPECLLFKNWSRIDRESSSLGRGFTFTAIAYSGERRGAAVNSTQYFFALDPEHAIPNRLHLYNVWASLQGAEIRALKQAPPDAISNHADTTCRPGYEARAGEYGKLFDDPWFDGSNYCGTIVVTPNRGTFIGPPGAEPDLSDDPLMRIVLDEVAAAALPGKAKIIDVSIAQANVMSAEFDSIQAAIQGVREVAPLTYRFGKLQMAEGIDPTAGRSGEQIGRMLWQLLDLKRHGVPTDFVERHLLVTPESVSVWSRAGIITAVNPRGREAAELLEKNLRELIDVAREIGQLSSSEPHDDHGLQSAVESAEELSRRLTALRQYLSFPEGRLLRRFFEATKLSEFVNLVRDMHINRSNALTAKRLDSNLGYVASVQNAVEWLEIFIVSFYSVELTHTLGGMLQFNHLYNALGTITIGTITSLTIALSLKPWAKHTAHVEPEASDGEHHSETTLAEGFSMHPLGRSLVLMAGLLVIFLGLGLAMFVEHHEEGCHCHTPATHTTPEQEDAAKQPDSPAKDESKAHK